MKPVKPVVWVLLGIFSVYLAIAAASAYEEGSYGWGVSVNC